jgi:hypothetical protein
MHVGGQIKSNRFLYLHSEKRGRIAEYCTYVSSKTENLCHTSSAWTLRGLSQSSSSCIGISPIQNNPPSDRHRLSPSRKRMESRYINLRRTEPSTPATTVPRSSRLGRLRNGSSGRSGIGAPLVAVGVKQEEIDRGLTVSTLRTS